jgi:hypothetical protein
MAGQTSPVSGAILGSRDIPRSNVPTSETPTSKTYYIKSEGRPTESVQVTIVLPQSFPGNQPLIGRVSQSGSNTSTNPPIMQQLPPRPNSGGSNLGGRVTQQPGSSPSVLFTIAHPTIAPPLVNSSNDGKFPDERPRAQHPSAITSSTTLQHPSATTRSATYGGRINRSDLPPSGSYS